MRTTTILIALALCLIVGLPTAAEAGNEAPGACLFDVIDGVTPLDIGDGLFEFAVCIDGLEELECLALCKPVGDDPDGIGGFCEFLPGETCADQPIPWDGACDGVFSPIGDLCILIASPSPGDSQLLCEGKGAGTWLGDGSVCGGVPVLPKLAYGVLALVLLAGTLTLLTLQSRP
jgi:hypothetical protein